MSTVEYTLERLSVQEAPASHLERVKALVALAADTPGLLAVCLVGSYAKGTGDRVSDLDLVVLAGPAQAGSILTAIHALLNGEAVLGKFTGVHLSGGVFWKYVYLDFSTVECHVFEQPTSFRLIGPYLAIWDPHALLPSLEAPGQPKGHGDFAAYEYGDEGLMWELVDCIKWLSRGHSNLARQHLKKLGAALTSRFPRQG